jgi:hypothetical protein
MMANSEAAGGHQRGPPGRVTLCPAGILLHFDVKDAPHSLNKPGNGTKSQDNEV